MKEKQTTLTQQKTIELLSPKDRNDDGLQKASNGFADLSWRNDEVLERV